MTRTEKVRRLIARAYYEVWGFTSDMAKATIFSLVLLALAVGMAHEITGIWPFAASDEGE